jgi:hypothetical protein
MSSAARSFNKLTIPNKKTVRLICAERFMAIALSP